MIKWLIRILWGRRGCAVDGHDYRTRYDDMIDPRIDASTMCKGAQWSSTTENMRSLRARVYVRDVCNYCGDTIDRIEGLNAMQVIAMQSGRIRS